MPASTCTLLPADLPVAEVLGDIVAAAHDSRADRETQTARDPRRHLRRRPWITFWLHRSVWFWVR